MTATLAVNAFLKGKKFDTLHSHLINSAKEMGIDLKIMTNLQLMTEPAVGDFVLFWDKDVTLARLIESRGVPVFNSADAIEKCDNKGRTYIELSGKVKQPDTLIAPLTFFDNSDFSAFIDSAAAKLGLPLVFKECYGSFGAQVFLCHSKDEIKSHITSKPFLLQKYVKTSYGQDVRIEVIDGKCVAATKRENKSDFRSNVTNGGTMRLYTPTDSEKESALLCADILELLFCGVDILNDGSVCEVNSNAHIINLKNATGIDVAPMIFKSISERIK